MTQKWIVDIEIPIALLEDGVPAFFDQHVEKVIEITTPDHSETIAYARDEETAQIIAQVPALLAERDRLKEVNQELVTTLKNLVDRNLIVCRIPALGANDHFNEVLDVITKAEKEEK